MNLSSILTDGILGEGGGTGIKARAVGMAGTERW